MTRLDGLAFDLKSLATFTEVAETGSMTTAAERLGLTQPAVTRTIARLENAFGTSLLDRRARPLKPTATGHELLERARRLLAGAEQLQSSVRNTSVETLPSVRLGLIDSFTVTAGPLLIRKLRGHAQNVIVWSGISPNLRQDLLRQRLDFMVATDPMAGHHGIASTRIMREPFLLIMPKVMAETIATVDLHGLARNHPFVRYSARSMIGARIERYLADVGIDIPQRLEFDGSEAVFAMVAAGLGWAITTPLCLIHSHGYTAGLVARPLPGRGFDRSLYLVGHRYQRSDLGTFLASASRDIARTLAGEKIRPLAPWAADATRIG